MNYLKLETCKKLQELGCVSESGYVWTNLVWDEFEDMGTHLSDFRVEDTLQIQSEYLFKRATESDSVKMMSEKIISIPTFCFEDLTIKENAIRIWPDRKWMDKMWFPQTPEEKKIMENGGIPRTISIWRDRITYLLHMKLNGEDWEAELLKYLSK